MRVLLTAHAFPPRSTAGVEVYTLRLARALRARGHEVLVLAAVHDLAAPPYSIRRRRHEDVDVVDVVNVHHIGTLEATYDDPGIDRALNPVIEAFRPDVVHAQHLLNLSAGLLDTARRTGAATLLTLHDYWLSCPRDGLRMRADGALCATMDHAVCAACLADSPYLVPPLQRGLSAAARQAGLGGQLHKVHALAPRIVEKGLALARRVAPASAASLAEDMDRRADRLRALAAQVDLFLAPTAFARERALEFGLDPAQVQVRRLGAIAGPAKPRPAKPRRRVGFVGTLAPHKGVDVLIRAFRSLPGADLTLDLHGSLITHAGYVAELRRAADGDPRIRFHGPFAEGEQPRVLSAIDLLALPSVWWENSPLTVLEALAAGIPVVASAIGGLPEIVAHGDTGLLVPASDAEALRRALADITEGRVLAEGREPVPLPTAADGARELEELYARRAWVGPRAAPAASAPRATVVTLVKDGSPYLGDLMDSLNGQELPGGLEVLAVDSGSTDGSPAILEAHGARVLRVPPDAFDHGETRNLAAREARGTVVVFLSQDALPAGPRFVLTLVEALEADPRLAGAFARQVPRAGADPLTRRDLASWVAGSPASRVVFLPESSALEMLSPLERHRLLAFDDVASAVRREVLLAHPFVRTRFGEDVEWAQRVLREGFGIVYVPSAVVVHSHARTVRGLFRRNYLGHRVLQRLFGLRTIPDLPHLVRASAGAVASDLATLALEGASASAWLAAPAQALAASYGQYRGARDEVEGRPYPDWA
ncbi:MAG TPA: glycosyltransferase [Vicinamibacteria bacterium]|nr:glycosyltransferase [Vicinamibacteria bacterium]